MNTKTGRIVPLMCAVLLVTPMARLHAADPNTPDTANSCLAPMDLRCECRTNPAGIDAEHPRLSWTLQDKQRSRESRGQKQTAYRVLVASSETLLAQDKGDLWDSGKVARGDGIALRYGGAPLASETRYWWKVRAWDRDGHLTGWSQAAAFLTGKLRQEDWRGKWIGPDLVRTEAWEGVLGFAVEAKRADEAHWVQVDLGKSQRIDRVVLHPMRHHDPAAGGWINGYAFPLRFRIEVSEDATFIQRGALADLTGEDYPNPGLVPVVFDGGGRIARYVRLTVTKSWSRGVGLPYVFTLGEMQVFSGDSNVSAGAAVEASASVEGYGWSKRQLTDGKALCPSPEDRTREKRIREHGAVYLRKEFDLTKPAVQAVLSFSGLGFSEVAIDGRKVGDYVIGPGFTDYDHRVPYLTFDVTDRFATVGHKRLDVILADGWYALERDPWVHQLEKRPYVDLPKLRLDLRLVGADGAEIVVASDESWEWSAAEITRSWIAQEDLDLRKAGARGRTWRRAVPVPAPRGRLQYQKEPSNHIVEELRPASMQYDAGTGTATYELGREVQGWVRFRARGPEGTALCITTIPSDPAYFRTNMFVLAGTGDKETYEPRFFYVAIKQVKVTGLLERPAPEDLTVCRISSLRTPAGAFSCSDEFVNWLEQCVRRTAMNYTTFLPNDPVREWKAWTQDIQSMFGSMFYLFAESQPMYERWHYDLLDSQQADGNMANVAPGPVFDAYNSPWWGGCGVWLPWEWRLAYGDDSLLRDSYAAMKRYVDFLGGQADKAGGLQQWGLGDWLPVEETPATLINTPAHYRLARVVEQTATILGYREDEQRYAAMADRVRDVFNRTFLDPVTGIYGQKGWNVQKGNWEVPGGLGPLHEIWWEGGRPATQAGQVLPLAAGLVPEAARSAVEAALLRELSAHKGRLSTGFVSTPYLLDVLADLDPEGSWRLVTSREFLSWYSMTRGSGNDLMKETWAGGQALMPSLGGSVARWCYRALGGIRPDPEGPGFRRIIIRPMVVKGLGWVRCHHDSPLGRIVSNWRKQDGRLVMEITVPPGAVAKVYVPARTAAGVTENGRPAAQSEGERLLREEPSSTLFETASGCYEFSVRAD
jgi:alpha-L-rhamnosidase